MPSSKFSVLSKVIFYPMTVWSMRSMKAMQALQPQVNALRSKHKSDPQRAQRENAPPTEGMQSVRGDALARMQRYPEAAEAFRAEINRFQAMTDWE